MDWSVIITAVVTVTTALGGGYLTMRAALRKTEVDAQTQVQSGFIELTKLLREERVVLTSKIEQQSARIEQQSEVIGRQSSEINSLQRKVADMESLMAQWLQAWKAGEKPPRDAPYRGGNR